MKRIAFLLVSFGGLLHAQGCNFINPSSTPNIGLLLPSTNNSCNWGVYTNQSMSSLDLFLSGHSGIPAINFLPQTLFGNPVSGLTLYVNPGDGLFHTRNSVGIDAVLGSGGGGAVSSVFGRTGAVVAVSGDYTAAQVTNAASKTAANVYSAFSQDFRLVPSFFIAARAGAAPTVDGDVAIDLTTHTYQFGSNGQTLAIPYVIGVPPTTGNCIVAGVGPYQLSSITCPSGITQLTGDGGAGPGSGSQAFTLTTVNSNVGTFGDSTHVGRFTVDGKGRITAASSVAISGGGGAASSITAGPLSSLPATCTPGDVYFATDQPRGEQLYQCSATNTFTQTFLHDSTLVNTAGSFGVSPLQFCQFTNSCLVAGFWDFGGASATAPNKVGLLAARPTTCVVGQTYFVTNATAGQNVFGCTATNTWTLQGGGSAPFDAVVAEQSTGTSVAGSFVGAELPFNTNISITTAALHSTTVNPQNFVIQTTGFYHGQCNLFTSDPSVTNIGLMILINGAGINANQRIGNVSNGYAEIASFDRQLTASDIVTCYVQPDTTITTGSGLGKSSFSLFQVH